MVTAQRILKELRANRVTHVVGLPDNSSAKLLELLSRKSDIRPIPVTREGEAFAIAAGLWMGGGRPVVMIQNTGFFESGDSFRGTITRMRVPLVCLITYRGFARMKARILEIAANPDALSRADLDSAALITEPTLKAWGLPYVFLHEDGDVPLISDAFRKAEESEQPMAVMITGNLI